MIIIWVSATALRALSNVVDTRSLLVQLEVWYHQKAFHQPWLEPVLQRSHRGAHTIEGRLTERRGGPQQHTHRSGLPRCLEAPDSCSVVGSGTHENKHADIQSFRIIQALVDESPILFLGSKDAGLLQKRQFERTSSSTGPSTRGKWGSCQLMWF